MSEKIYYRFLIVPKYMYEKGEDVFPAYNIFKAMHPIRAKIFEEHVGSFLKSYGIEQYVDCYYMNHTRDIPNMKTAVAIIKKMFLSDPWIEKNISKECLRIECVSNLKTVDFDEDGKVVIKDYE